MANNTPNPIITTVENSVVLYLMRDTFNANSIEQQLVVFPDDTSCTSEGIMKRSELYLHFKLPTLQGSNNLPFKVLRGTYCEKDGIKWVMYKDGALRKIHDREYEYTCIFNPMEAGMQSFDEVLLQLNRIDINDPYIKRVEFKMRSSGSEYLRCIVGNINKKLLSSGITNYLYTAGEMLADEERFFNGNYTQLVGGQTITRVDERSWRELAFNETTIYTALQNVADAWESEWEIETVSFQVPNNLTQQGRQQYKEKYTGLSGSDLNSVPNTFTAREVRLRKEIKYYTGANERLELSAGISGGLIGDIQVTTITDEPPIKKVYIKSGGRNLFPKQIDAVNGNYEFQTLHLPTQNANAAHWVNGQINESIYNRYNKQMVQQLIETYNFTIDPKENSVEYVGRGNNIIENGVYKEQVVDFSEIYPSREFTVVAVRHGNNITRRENNAIVMHTVVNWEGEVPTMQMNAEEYGIFVSYSTSEPFVDVGNVNVQIAGSSPHIRFQTGMLAGEKDFNVLSCRSYVQLVYESDAGFKSLQNVAYYRLEPIEIDDYIMPSVQWLPSVGDVFIFFNIILPTSYIRKAEQKLLEQTLIYMYESLQKKVQVNAQLSSVFVGMLRENDVFYRLRVGTEAKIIDETLFFGSVGSSVLLRIVSKKAYFTQPNKIECEFSDKTILRSKQRKDSVIHPIYNENKKKLGYFENELVWL